MDGDRRFLTFFDPFEELIIALGLFDGSRRQDSRIGIPFAPVQAEFAAGLIDDEIDDLQHVLVIFIGGVEELMLHQGRFQMVPVFIGCPRDIMFRS